ncbi:uncharacterized protein N7479_010657 [Penicillium vulpinum]|uniref:Protein kinase domain-containing protein n=1 Tax=Penicillium vulpinum TaxID=29845 RepID=A0A1V6S910_9EURO|nr:uncharacterized protein N7479_010657 [Penicillium vulpinum]KAJ5952244.1 hypothetical protein N7479_010657 [Penicillium vulpinum]OQE10260.1 hypothetical protein PENVUL_c004G03657 [Penicillium vulpinum]
MEPVSFAFAACSMVELCIKYGRSLHARCQAYIQAEAELANTLLCIEGYWLKIEDEVTTLRDIWNGLDGRLQIHHNQVLQTLLQILQNAYSTLGDIFGEPENSQNFGNLVAQQGKIQRLKYAAYGKKSLERIVEQLEHWHRHFDPSWILLSRLSVPIIQQKLAEKGQLGNKAIVPILQLREAHNKSKLPTDECLTTSIFLDADYPIKNTKGIPFTTASMGLAPTGKMVIVDKYTSREDVDHKVSKKDVRDLAVILSKVNPTFSSLLPCQGVITAKDQSHFRMVFTVPCEMSLYNPCSLRSMLLNRANTYPLNERVHLAVSLARSVVFLHASRIVHKSISPENIIILHPGMGVLGTPLLVGFERFRFDEQRTNMVGDNLWEKNLYRHPARQGLQPEEIYNMRHDIYSIGACLLEIGLWKSFVYYMGDQTVPSSELPITDMLTTKSKRKAAVEIKSTLIDLAKMNLPQKMGKIYTDTVINCLTCLDSGSQIFQDESEFEDEDGILVGVRYIEKILFEIEKIVV